MNACGNSNEVEEVDLRGDWIVEFAERNGRGTELVNGAVFAFSRERLETDWTGILEKGDYKLENGTVVHNVPGVSEYDIILSTTDTLILAADVKGYRFQLGLVKRPDEEL